MEGRKEEGLMDEGKNDEGREDIESMRERRRKKKMGRGDGVTPLPPTHTQTPPHSHPSLPSIIPSRWQG